MHRKDIDDTKDDEVEEWVVHMEDIIDNTEVSGKDSGSDGNDDKKPKVDGAVKTSIIWELWQWWYQ